MSRPVRIPVPALIAGAWDWASTNTDTDARPSVNTRCATGSVDPGIVWAERAVILNPGGSFRHFHTSDAARATPWTERTRCAAIGSRRSKPRALKAESGMRDDSVRLAKTICSMTWPWASQLCLQGHRGRVVDPEPIAVAVFVLRRDGDDVGVAAVQARLAHFLDVVEARRLLVDRGKAADQ